MMINKATRIDTTEEEDPRTEVVAVEAEDEVEATPDPTHAGYMLVSMIGLSVGTMNRVRIIDQIGMLVVVAEAASKIGVVAEALGAITTTIMVVVEIFRITITNIIKDQPNNISSVKAITISRVDHP